MAFEDADLVAQYQQLGLISGAVAKRCKGEVDEELEAGLKYEEEHGRRLIVAGLGRSPLAARWLPRIRNMHPYREQRFAVLGLVLICTSTVRADIAPFELSIYAVRRLVDTIEPRLWSICSILSGRPPQDPTPLGC